MTSIEQLQISGIRSFDPNPFNKQTVCFQKPLTVILGKNGAGKTTIIEALLNACTGAMPPGSGTEKSSFVYDPKAIGESEVKAQIRLIFTGKGGKLMQVIRSFQVARSRNKTTFTTLDNTVAFQDTASGKVISSTYRASDVDRVVPEMLGVSPAVLQHVIFCHQEASNWPLAPPKEVKGIFDDIFAATRYVLALERLRENSKELRRQQKEHEASLMALREHRDQAKQLEQDITQKEELVATIRDRNKSLEPELQELRSVQSALDAVEQNIDSLNREAAVVQGRMEEKRESIRRAGLPPCKQSLEEMLELKKTFAGQVAQAEAELAGKAQQLASTEGEVRRLEEEQYHLRSQLQLVEREDQQHKRQCATLREVLSATSSGFVFSENSVDERSLTRVMAQAQEAVRAAHTAAEAARQRAGEQVQAEEERRQTALRGMDSAGKEAELLEGTVKSVSEQIRTVSEAMAQLNADAARERLAQLQGTIARLEERVEAAEALRQKGAHHQRRLRLLQELDEQNRRVAQLMQEMAKANQRVAGQADVALLREQLKERRATLSTALAEEILPALHTLGLAGRIAPAGADEEAASLSLAAATAPVEAGRRQKLTMLSALTQEQAMLEREVAVLEQRKAQSSEELVRAESELKAKLAVCVEALGSAADVDRFEGYVTEAQAAASAALQKQHGLEAMSACYGEFVKVAQQTNSCAVCDRPFADHAAMQHFVEVNESRQQSSPAALEAAQQEAALTSARAGQLEGLRKTVEDVRQLQKRVPELEKAGRELHDRWQQRVALRADAQHRREDVETQLERLNDLLQQLAGLHRTEAEVDSLATQLVRREKQLAELLQSQRHSSDATMTPSQEEEVGEESMEALTAAYEEATAQLHRLNVQLTEAQRMDEGASDAAVERELHTAQQQRFQLEVTVSKFDDLRRTEERLREELQTHRDRLASLRLQRREQQPAVDAMEATLRQLRTQQREVEQAERAKVAAAEQLLRQLEAAVPPVLEYIRGQHGEALPAARAKLQQSESTLQYSKAEAQRLSQDVAETKRVVEDQSRRSVEINRQIDVLELQRAMEADAARLKDMERALAELKGSKLQNVEQLLGDGARHEPLPRLRELVRLKMSELEKAQAQQQGSVEAIVQDVNQLKGQLAREKYHNIEKRYRSTFLKVQTTEIAVKDIDKYYGALEKAVQSYHQEKIAQINQIIGDLWRQTYRGSDIDTVEIRSETDGSAGGASSPTAQQSAAATTASSMGRRSYNYRVVMKRGNTEIDMRGRCSAGQKVLASIIIRLALSEAFCCDCGILALDEPTTNLDEDNARSLAEALRVLIETRRAIKHFQLIIITHDEQFVRALGGQALDRFYYVHKDREGAFSIVDERTFDQLFA